MSEKVIKWKWTAQDWWETYLRNQYIIRQIQHGCSCRRQTLNTTRDLVRSRVLTTGQESRGNLRHLNYKFLCWIGASGAIFAWSLIVRDLPPAYRKFVWRSNYLTSTRGLLFVCSKPEDNEIFTTWSRMRKCGFQMLDRYHLPVSRRSNELILLLASSFGETMR